MWHCLSIPLPRLASTVENLLSNFWGDEPLRSETDRCDVEEGGCGVYRRRSKDSEGNQITHLGDCIFEIDFPSKSKPHLRLLKAIGDVCFEALTF